MKIINFLIFFGLLIVDDSLIIDTESLVFVNNSENTRSVELYFNKDGREQKLLVKKSKMPKIIKSLEKLEVNK